MLKIKPGPRRTPDDLSPRLIAPCGINCGLCMCFLRDKNACRGCRAGDEGKPKSCINCAIRNCDSLRTGESVFCWECVSFPCPRLRRLDARYRGKYRTNVIDNLRAIRDQGIEAHVESEKQRWACPECGGLQCMHTAECVYCGHVWS
jgi:hypothetical protein